MEDKMRRTAEYWIKTLDLQTHPEGGFYKRNYTASRLNEYRDFEGPRPSCTAIYYLLFEDQFSSFHKIKSDELWHYYDGNTSARIHILEDGDRVSSRLLGLEQESTPQLLAPKEQYFCAELVEKKQGSYALMGCTVSPGFDFSDLDMPAKAVLLQKYPQHKSIVDKFTYE